MKPRTGNLRPRIVAVLQADTSPAGMTLEALRAALGSADARTVSKRLAYAVLVGEVFCIGKARSRDVRYFGTAERMEACREAAEAAHAQRAQATRDRERARLRLRRDTRRGHALKATNQARIREALQADTSSIGMSTTDLLEATGLETVPLRKAITALRKHKGICWLGHHLDTRYYATAERRLACMDAFEAHVAKMAAERAERKRAYDQERKRAANPPKPRHKQQSMPITAPPVTLRRRQPLPANAPVVWPEHVKIQEVDGYKGDPRYTFDPPKGWRGEISRDWLERRLRGDV